MTNALPVANVRNRASFRIEFPGAPITDRVLPKSIRIVQKPGAHDIAVFGLHTPDRYRGLLPGAPVAINWSGQRGSSTFNGYLYRIEPIWDSSNAQSANFICVGASYPLMNKASNVWTSTSASDVVKDIAFQHGLGADVEFHPRIYGQIAQAGDSYWKLLVRLAEETGYVLRMDRSTIVFRSRDSLMKHYRPIAPNLHQILSTNPSSQAYGDIINFRVRTGEFTPELGSSRATRSLSGVDPVTGSSINKSVGLADPYRSDIDPVFEEHLTNVVINTQAELDSALSASQEKNRFTRFANMETWGLPYIAPERVLHLQGMDSEFAGFWTVRSVTHNIDTRNYKCDVEVATDGLGGPLTLVGEPVREYPGNLIPVDPHRPGALSWPYPEPVLQGSSNVVGTPGQALTDFSWVAPVRTWRTA